MTATDSPARLDIRFRSSGDEAGTAPEDRRFRPDVQGLRAIAVVLALLFHAHVPGMGGGYVGVDVFFVISGFVITGVLLRERAATGRTSIAGFYARRVRRILPAATLVIIASVIASYALLGPVSGGQTANDARWASVFLINVHFASTGTNYLASQLPPSVLQNYWSLAVEEQFYVVYPTVFLVAAAVWPRFSLRRRLGVVLGGAMVVSLIASIVQTSNNATAAYFSPLPRVWELALGGLVAVSTVGLRRVPAFLAAVLSWIGLMLIVLAAVLFSESTSYPGAAVAVPVIGAALVIAGGVARPSFGAEWMLRLRPFQWIGLISYSLYLWHWPVLTLAAEHGGGGTLPVWDALGWELVSLGLAVATYRSLENPIRHSARLRARPWVSLALGGCLIGSSLTVATVELRLHPGSALATPGLAGLSSGQGCPSPSSEDLRALMGAATANRDVVARVLLVGDSTACTMLPGLDAVALPAGVQVENAAVVGCGIVSGELAPFIVNGNNLNRGSRLCQRHAVDAEQRAVKSGRPNVVLWASSWEREPLLVGTGTHQRVLVAGSPQWYAVLAQRMEARIHEWTAEGATVVMLTQPPFVDLGTPSGPTAGDASFERLNAFLTAFAAKEPHVRAVNLAAYVCPSGPPCPIIVDNIWARGDGAHYTGEGALWVARWLMPRLGIPALTHEPSPLPDISLVGVRNGEEVKGVHQVAVLGSFNLGIARVLFRASGPTLKNTVIGEASFAQNLWGISWNTAAVPDGTYVLHGVAYNARGDHTVSKGITVRVDN